ncbi:MAG: M28 family peptidase [Gemmatimonadetes bacterium]|nr:M28 family peptidase [Gemmatimonadota bacterium]
MTCGPALLMVTALASAAAAQPEGRFRAFVSADSISALHAPLTRRPHIAGTPASLAMARHLERTLRRFGLAVEVRAYQPWLSHPKRIAVEMKAPTRHRFSLREPPVPGDPTSAHAELGPGFIAYSGSGTAEAPVVYVNYGLPADYARLASLGVAVRGRIVLARYGQSHRAVKVHTAEAAGAAALILYSDPADDGFTRGLPWPAGPWRGSHLIQRGNAKLSWFWHGDPLTPGVAAVAGAARLDPATAPTLPTIPVVVLSAAEAEPFLRTLGGPDGPAGFQGGLPFPYRVGPGPAVARVSVSMANGLKPIRNVIATIRGSEEPDRTVLLGTHHDAWTFGAVDPGTGVAVLLETARALGQLTRTGWRPRRSIAFAFWDAEEFGLIGSTEYAEELRTRLQRELVAYINTDMSTVGRFDPGGVPSLRDFVADVARAVDEGGTSVFDRWRSAAWRRLPAGQRPDSESELVPELKALGSGADFVPFQDHLGVPTLSLEFIGENGYGFGTYHSNSDSRTYVERMADPGFRQGAVLSQVLGTAAIRLADAEVLPFRFSHSASTLDHAVAAARAWAGAMAVDFGPLATQSVRVGQAAARLEARIDAARKAGALAPGAKQRLNDGLARLEQQLTDDEGDPATRWYRHVVYGWNIYSLYDGQPFPGLAEAFRTQDPARAEHEAGRIRRALERLTLALDSLLPSPSP